MERAEDAAEGGEGGEGVERSQRLEIGFEVGERVGLEEENVVQVGYDEGVGGRCGLRERGEVGHVESERGSRGATGSERRRRGERMRW